MKTNTKASMLSPSMGGLKALGKPGFKKFIPKKATNKASLFTKGFKG